MKNMIRQNCENIVSYILSIALASLFLIRSPLHPWVCGPTVYDSSVFKTVAMMMQMGYMPYKDTFDHKGPFLYILNYFGNIISYYRGVWVIELLSLTVTIVFMYKIARLSCKKVSSIITVLLSMSLLFTYFDGGNYTEEYSMPCISFSLFVFLDYLINYRMTKIRNILVGVCLGIVLMLRPNMISVWIVFCFYILLKLLINKKYIDLIHLIIYFFLGIGIVIIPIVIWLIVNGAFTSFLYDYIVINKLYTSTEGGRALFSAKWSSFIYFANTTVYIMSFTTLLFSLRVRSNRYLKIIYLLYLFSTVVLMVMSGMPYDHYGMVIIPAVVYPISMIFNSIEIVESNNVRYMSSMIVGGYCLVALIIPKWFGLVESIPLIYENKDNNNYGIDISNVVNYIEDNTNESDTISVYGNWNIIYVLSKRRHATLYSYQFPICKIVPSLMEDYYNQLSEELPKIIVVQPDYMDDDMQKFIEENDYSLLWEINTDYMNSGAVYTR